jgi:hypothetical protein
MHRLCHPHAYIIYPLTAPQQECQNQPLLIVDNACIVLGSNPAFALIVRHDYHSCKWCNRNGPKIHFFAEAFVTAASLLDILRKHFVSRDVVMMITKWIPFIVVFRDKNSAPRTD